MAPKCVPANDFTIGWVCALPIELAAASGMMDEDYAQLLSQPTDSNMYSYGRIGVHNIVVACLPAGQMGTNSAATVASQMKSSFPSLRFGLLVGIGGGVPNVEDDVDIRLGDVVISQPSGQYGGVIQYDFGKTGADGRIARIGSLNAPPTILLNASSQLRANDILDKTKVDMYLSEFLSSKPKFASPGPKKDVLYEAKAQHIGGATCKKCRPEDEVDREERMTTDPMLFFGNIASGNQVMKDGQTRDKHSRDLGGILCFEMEAAGLMNNFPCLVIRGICDYADAHKNKQWQPYAAATAAALAKELLCTIPSTVSSAENVAESPPRQPHFIVTFGRNKNFVGRDQILMKLLERIPPSADKDACQRTAIVGLGGIGKTQVAIEAAYRVRDAHPDCSVFWVPAVSVAMFENYYRKIGHTLEVRGIEDDKEDVKTLVKAALEREETNEWPLIVDNADDVDLVFAKSGLASYIPFNRKGSILLTSRNSIAAARYDRTHALHLSQMNHEEAVKLLHSGLNESQIDQSQSTSQLLERLAHLPLAIRQASAYLRTNSYISIYQYLKYCEASDEEQIHLLSEDFDDQDRYEDGRNPVATTWLISFEHIARDKPLAAKYLRFICYLAEKDIPVAILPPATNERQTHEAISTLMAYAFILSRGFSESFDIHRLIRLVMQNWLKSQDKEEEQVTETIKRLSAVFPLPVKRMNKAIWIAFMPHAEAALKMHRQALELKEKVLKPEDPTVLASLDDLAETFNDCASFHGNQEKFKEAEKMIRQLLLLSEKRYGPEHPNTVMTLHNLASVLRSQERNREAEEIFRQTLELSKKVLGPEDPRTLINLARLGDALGEQEKYEEAEKIYQQALQSGEKVLGPEDSITLTNCLNLLLGYC
ncbi:hypothetical protein K456DRAFT_1773148 [Colletotrichum gloeosporioides 23]|nr:hypothetical protein K456DRAFT_1773148 [Colletotrichum gloeosporioides 23]